jgi:hypothetical protein
MNEQQRLSVKRRANAPPVERHTTQDAALPRQRSHPMRDTTYTLQGDSCEDAEEQFERVRRVPNSARYVPIEQRGLVPVHTLQDRKTERARRQKHPLFYLGLGLFSAGAILGLILGPGGTWWNQWRDDSTYGNPRTFQIDAIVGQGDGPSHPSHFIALNLGGQLIVIEFPGADPSKGRDFLITTLYGPNASKVPVTLSFADANHDGKPDLLVHFEGQQVVYLNDHATFRPAKPGEVPPQ